MNKIASYSIGILMIFLNVVCLVLESELYQGIQSPSSKNYYNKPYFITWFSGIGYAFFLIPFFIERMRYQFFTQKRALRDFVLFEEEEKMILIFALIAYFPYYLAGYAWMISLPETSVSANLIIYNSTFIFVFGFSYFFLKERVTAMKIASIILSFIGVVITTYSSVNSDDESGLNQTLFGYLLLIISVIITALYDVFYKFFSSRYVNSLNNHAANHKLASSINNGEEEDDVTAVELFVANEREDKIVRMEKGEKGEQIGDDLDRHSSNKEIQSERLSTSLLGTGAIGLFAFTTLWPGLLLLHFLNIEPFEMPSQGVVNELLLVVMVDGMQNSFSFAGISFTSPLFMSLGGLLSIPLSILGDLFFHSYLLPWLGFLGVFSILLGFLLFSFDDYRRPPL